VRRSAGGTRREPYKASGQRTANAEAANKLAQAQTITSGEIHDLHKEYQANLANAVSVELQKLSASFGQELQAVKIAFNRENLQLREEIKRLSYKVEKLEAQNNDNGSGMGQGRHTPHTAHSGDIVSKAAGYATNKPRTSHTSVKSSSHTNKSFAQVAAEQSSPSEAPWSQVVHRPKSKASKNIQSTLPIKDPTSRRLLFPRETGAPQKAEEDIFLGINEMLKRAGAPSHVRVERVSYSASGSISVLLKERAHTSLLLPAYKDGLIKAVRAVDPAVTGVEAIEKWHRVKIHGLSIERYGNGEDGMLLFQREIEASTDLILKARPRWLFNPERLVSRWMEGGRPNSTIVITVGSEREAKNLCAKGLKLGKGTKPAEKYWDQGPGAVCQTCCGIGHDKYRGCGERPPQCVICAGSHRMPDHKCSVSGCTTQAGRACIHDTVKCANCGGNHQASAIRCPAKVKAETMAKTQRVNSAGHEITVLGPNDQGSSSPLTVPLEDPTSPVSEESEPEENMGVEDLITDASCI
jgi:hypothetical protein